MRACRLGAVLIVAATGIAIIATSVVCVLASLPRMGSASWSAELSTRSSPDACVPRALEAWAATTSGEFGFMQRGSMISLGSRERVPITIYWRRSPGADAITLDAEIRWDPLMDTSNLEGISAEVLVTVATGCAASQWQVRSCSSVREVFSCDDLRAQVR